MTAHPPTRRRFLGIAAAAAGLALLPGGLRAASAWALPMKPVPIRP